MIRALRRLWETEDSVVAFTLTPVGDKTRVALLHENVEAFDYQGTKEGWELYYLGAIKQRLEERHAKPAPKTRAAQVHAQKENAQEEITKAKLLRRETTRATH